MLERVLLADDVPLNREIYRSLLEGAVRHFDEAGDGAEACALFRQHRYDAVLLDIQMPGLDGYDALKAMRALEAAQNLPATLILAVTTSDCEEDGQRMLAAGATAFLDKPLKREVLLPLLQRHHAARPLGNALAKLLPKLFVIVGGMLDEMEQSSDPQAVSKLLHQLRGLLAFYGFASLDEGLKLAHLGAQQGKMPDSALYARWREELRRLEADAVSCRGE